MDRDEVQQEDRASRAKAYTAGNYRLYFVNAGLDLLGMLAIIAFVSPAAADLVRANVPWTCLQVMLFTTILFAFLTAVGLPLSYYSGFRREHRYGLSNQTLRGWVWESTKGAAVALVFAWIAAAALYWTLATFPRGWWLIAAALALLFTLVLSRLGPVVILPLFYKTTPIDDAGLRERLSGLARDAGLRISGVYRIDLSKNTKKLNAALTGLGRSRRVLLGDTLLEKMDADEIAVVFAHEVGHHARHHIPRLIAVHALGTVLLLWLCSLAIDAVLPVLKIERLAGLETLPVVAMALDVFGFVARPLYLAYSRRLEVESDRYALEKTGLSAAFVRGMTKLALGNLADASPSRLAELFFYSHPPIAKRIARADAQSKITSERYRSSDRRYSGNTADRRTDTSSQGSRE